MFIFDFLQLNTITVYTACALLPAVILMAYIYAKDKRDKEPAYMLRKMILGGLGAAAVAIVLEYIGEYVLVNLMEFRSEEAFYCAVALMVALAEEGGKLFFAYRGSWKDKNLNYSFDAIVYCVFVSLGFAAIENVKYVFTYGLSVAPSRAVLTVPAHMCFAVFMGIFYGRAKRCDNLGDPAGRRNNLILAYAVPVLMHALYDGLLMVGSESAVYMFLGLVVVMDVVVFSRIRYESKNDVTLY